MPTRSGRRRRLLDGTLVAATHEPALSWHVLVRPPKRRDATKRKGAFYKRMVSLPTPHDLATTAPAPETFQGVNRRDRRAFIFGMSRQARRDLVAKYEGGKT